ncbi:MAG: hypothetical protein AB1650_00350 [Candidatus Omnitrophota bacterium]
MGEDRSNSDFGNIKEQIIQFDSCTALMNALARFLHGLDFPLVGLGHNVPSWLGSLVDAIPRKIRLKIYGWSGWIDALPSEKLPELRSENIDRWVASVYPKRQYPGIMFGSANGAAIHIAAALGIPWLPQTFLTAARRFLPPDEIRKDIEWGKQVIRPFLHLNPDLQTTQMHDPVQDRLMIQKMGYFRIKKMRLGKIYEKFILENLKMPAVFMTVECRLLWPALEVGERHYFQVGGLGSVKPYEYLHGSNRVKSFLKQMGSTLERWETFQPTGEFAEGEWGFVEQCLPDIQRFVGKHNIPWVRIIFDHPEDLAPFTAALYEWWYRRLGRASNILLIENFGLMAPFDTVEGNVIPFWLAFNTEDSLNRIKKYLERHHSFSEIYLMLMSNGVPDEIGLVTIDKWRNILATAKEKGDFIGVNEREYPLDFGTFIKYNQELKKKIKNRMPLPEPLSLEDLREFVETHQGMYHVQWKSS